MTIKLAIQEDMLPGATLIERCERALKLGFVGMEFWGFDLPARVPEIAHALNASGLRAAAVNFGNHGSFVASDPYERERVLNTFRQAICAAYDIGAAGVVFVPHFGAPALPDLSPWKTAHELQIEMLFMHLRTLSDFAYAIGVQLYLESINRYETTFLNRLDQAAAITRRLKHPDVRIVADVFHMALEESDVITALTERAADVGHVHLADHNRRLPGQGLLDFTQIAGALTAANYDGWAALECGQPTRNAPFAAQYDAELPACMEMLKHAGF